MNYAALGSILGHELTHSYDNIGEFTAVQNNVYVITVYSEVSGQADATTFLRYRQFHHTCLKLFNKGAVLGVHDYFSRYGLTYQKKQLITEIKVKQSLHRPGQALRFPGS
jgi:hypothetical protein